MYLKIDSLAVANCSFTEHFQSLLVIDYYNNITVELSALQLIEVRSQSDIFRINDLNGRIEIRELKINNFEGILFFLNAQEILIRDVIILDSDIQSLALAQAQRTSILDVQIFRT